MFAPVGPASVGDSGQSHTAAGSMTQLSLVSEPTTKSELSKEVLRHFSYETKQFNYIDRRVWIEHFNQLPLDPYVKQGFRYKAISWHNIELKIHGFPEDKVITLEHRALQQSAAYNPAHGDLRRDYPPVPSSLLERPDFERLILDYARFFKIAPEDTILFQLQRIDCLTDRPGRVAVEVMNRDNITGAETQISTDSKGENIVYRHTLQEGEGMYLNDRAFYHYGTDIFVADPASSDRGVRDIVLMSAPSQQHRALQ
ncbi:hypothetical protein PROFUN_02764 [Planoprotostelium fungivorum]|uniref:Uncharacterized protein n=1 Tax=Planoprotostelium fungivorum TaxID=1890364 RepID=A0A2P6NXM9_9EUKA|nr:hypothetical protein PROFUN_02764 [Planoprotostelium fungivorum]